MALGLVKLLGLQVEQREGMAGLAVVGVGVDHALELRDRVLVALVRDQQAAVGNPQGGLPRAAGEGPGEEVDALPGLALGLQDLGVE